MKKLTFFALLGLVMICATQAVSASGFGVRGGMNFSSLPSSEQRLIDNATIQALTDSYTGYHFGVVGHFSLLGFFVQPEFLFTHTGQQMVYRDRSGDLNVVREPEFFTQKFSHLTLPVIGGMKFGPLQVGVGPVFSYMLDSTRGNLHQQNIHFEYNKRSIGYQAMVGLKVGNFLLDLKYEGSLSKFGDGISVGGEEYGFDTRPQQFIVSIGLLIL